MEQGAWSREVDLVDKVDKVYKGNSAVRMQLLTTVETRYQRV